MATLHSILIANSKKKKRETKVEHLRENDSTALRYALQVIFDDAVRFDLPPGPPPDSYNTEGEKTLFDFVKEIPLFCKTKQQRNYAQALALEKKFMDVVEKLHPDDAKLLVAMKDKDVSKYKFDKQLVQDAFPGLIRK